MKRQILFRGKKKFSDDEWICGSYINTCSEHEISDINCIVGSVHEVIPETVGQFTGLTDKNGVKIFEGDVLLWGEDNKSVVTWGVKRRGFLIKHTLFRWGREEVKYYNIGVSKEVEVIGNIHEYEKN